MKMRKSQRGSRKISGGFDVHRNSAVLDPDMSRKVVRYARKRMAKSRIDDFVHEDVEKVPLLKHSQLILGERLGQGSFSSVYAVQAIGSEDSQEFDSHRIVVKVLRPKLSATPPMFSACAADLVKEGMIMATLNHRNIVSAKAWAPNGVSAYGNGRHDAFFLVLDRLEMILGGRIIDWQKQNKKINFSLTSRQSKRIALLRERINVIMELSEAIKFMHSKKVLHRDLKPDNIGFDCDRVLKVFDFDVARIVPDSSVPDDTFMLTKRVGSPRYMCPECARGEEYNLKADVYTFGLLYHELITLEKPYEDVPAGLHDEMVFYEGYRPSIPNSWPEAMKNLIQRCWSENISSRPTMEEAHQILKQAIPLIVAEKDGKKGKSKSTRRSTKTLPV